MPMTDNPLCLLALEERPNSFIPIDIKELGLDVSSVTLTLKEMDYLLEVYPLNYIRERIKHNNVCSPTAFDSPLVIIYEDDKNRKRKLPIISEQLYFEGNIETILTENISDKTFLNKLSDKIRLLGIAEEIKVKLIYFLKNGFVDGFLLIYNKLPYLIQRNMYIYIGNIYSKKNIRTREKINLDGSSKNE